MTYSTLAQVEAYISSTTINAATRPTDSQVTQIMADRAALIDSALGSRGYVVPVTAPAWFVAELAVLNARGAAGDVLLQAVPAFVDGVRVEDPYAQRLLDEFDARILEYQEGTGVPVGLARQELQQSPIAFFSDNGSWGNDLQVADDFGILIRSKPRFTVNRDL